MRTRRRLLVAVGSAAAGVATGGCSSVIGERETSTESGSGTFPGGSVTFALLPSVDEGTKRGYYEPFATYLEEELGMSVDLVYEETYSSVLEALGAGEAQISDAGSLTAALGARTGKLDIALQRKSFGNWTYGSVLVTREESAVDSVADIEGRHVAFGDRLSTSGMLMPLFMIQEAGVDIGHYPRDGGEAAFDATFSTHSEAWERLQDGDADVAGVGRFVTRNDDGALVEGVEYLDQYQKIPDPPFVTSPTLETDQKSRLVQTLADAPERVYDGADGEPDTDDDPWFSALRPATASRYQIVINAATTIDIRQDLLETSR